MTHGRICGTKCTSIREIRNRLCNHHINHKEQA